MHMAVCECISVISVGQLPKFLRGEGGGVILWGRTPMYETFIIHRIEELISCHGKVSHHVYIKQYKSSTRFISKYQQALFYSILVKEQMERKMFNESKIADLKYIAMPLILQANE